MLVSGEGTNLQALLDEPEIGPSIALVVSDRPGVPALERAARSGVRTEVLPPPPSRDTDLLALLRGAEVDLVVLAGYMRILDPAVVYAFPGLIVNVHPSLLPAFPGARAVRDALEAGVATTGVTVHVVVEELDSGPVVAQEEIEILPGDDEGSLLARIHDVEHRLLPAAVRELATRVIAG